MSAVSMCRADLEAKLRARKLDRTLVPVAGRMTLAAPETASTGIPAVDRQLGGGLPVGQCSEIVGPRSSGRTSVLLSVLAAATRRDERVALVDTFDAFDPESAAAAGVGLDKVLWVRGSGCTPAFPFMASRQSGTDRAIERALKAVNLVLQAGGFGVVALDLADAPSTALRRIPFTTWMRLQRVLDGQQTAALVVGNTPMCRSAGGVSIVLAPAAAGAHGLWASSMPSHLFLGLDTEMRVLRVQRVSGAEDEAVRMTASARVA
jgi:hypothetical protein